MKCSHHRGTEIRSFNPYRDERIANRQLGTVDQIDTEGNLQIHLDSCLEMHFNILERMQRSAAEPQKTVKTWVAVE